MLLWMLLATASPAQQGPAEDEAMVDIDKGLIPGLPPGPTPDPAEVDPRTQEISQTLRCPVCQGLSVADSTSSAAVMFQDRVRELVQAGYTDSQIRDYFVGRYGEWILLDPPTSGVNNLLYLVPAIALGGGLMWVVATVTIWRREPDEIPLPSDQGLVAMDEYEQQLLRELEE